MALFLISSDLVAFIVVCSLQKTSGNKSATLIFEKKLAIIRNEFVVNKIHYIRNKLLAILLQQIVLQTKVNYTIVNYTANKNDFG